ncbi:uncharacterized protein Dvir_GJ22864, isoform A [Drosophila virilis]|uniref:Uncharacterized protein, isoform A n=1 Tax=Drosophila virilis TaxID=7244 RepID=B4LVI5_DROVI|nr:protein lifeguard 1 isoform X1 [Drosophila virilis]EDW64379.2 uncharacterized protein Dvir_GJ22864, isoform A [Drosophila virilis]
MPFLRRSPSEDLTYGTDWDDDHTRRHFISKVCSIVALQMAVTTIITAIFLFVESANDLLMENSYIKWIALAGTLLTSLILICCNSVARKVPINYILLFLFTGFMALGVSCMSIYYTTRLILYAIGITLAICIALSLFAIFAPCDFTGWGPYLCVLSIVLVLMGLLAFFIRNRILSLVYCSLGLIIFSLYLVYDIQLMVGGRRNEFSEDDYIIAALGIYIDIIYIFIMILGILGLVDA